MSKLGPKHGVTWARISAFYVPRPNIVGGHLHAISLHRKYTMNRLQRRNRSFCHVPGNAHNQVQRHRVSDFAVECKTLGLKCSYTCERNILAWGFIDINFDPKNITSASAPHAKEHACQIRKPDTPK